VQFYDEDGKRLAARSIGKTSKVSFFFGPRSSSRGIWASSQRKYEKELDKSHQQR